MIILHASVCIDVEAGYCSRQEGKDSKRERSWRRRRFPRVPVDLT
jgi:hypothetical protein